MANHMVLCASGDSMVNMTDQEEVHIECHHTVATVQAT